MPEIFQAKSIVTMNAGRPRATHVLVSQGRVLSVGTEEDVASMAGKMAGYARQHHVCR